jgi:hypothetical protein
MRLVGAPYSFFVDRPGVAKFVGIFDAWRVFLKVELIHRRFRVLVERARHWRPASSLLCVVTIGP